MAAEIEKPSPIPKDERNEIEYPPKKQVIPAMIAVVLAVFVVALDRTIVGTAIPRITDDFNSFGDVSWYESGFLLPFCMLQLSFGLIYSYYSAKWILFSLVTIFEIGSIVCATASSSNALIVGRVITGIGGVGVSSGALVLINLLFPLESRPQWSGAIGATFGVSSVIGPLLGGYLTSVTWRWCFWINVPIGVVAVIVLAILCPDRPPPLKPAETLLGKVKQLDPLGFALIGPSIICLLFALQWGGTKYTWSDRRVIALFIVFGILLIAFVASQIFFKDHRTIPGRIISQRSVVVACVASLGIGSNLVIFAFYIPIWFQAIQGKSPQSAGLSLLPLLLSQVITIILAGVFTSKVGYYAPLLIIGGAITIVGAGLLTTWEVDTSAGKWIGYQIVTGVGIGLTLAQPNIAVQTVLPNDDVPIGISVVNFFQFLCSSVFVTVSQVLLEDQLINGLDGKVQFDPNTISSEGATSLRTEVPSDQLAFVLDVYNKSFVSIWYLALGLACLIFVSSFGLEWKSVKKEQSKKEGGIDAY